MGRRRERQGRHHRGEAAPTARGKGAECETVPFVVVNDSPPTNILQLRRRACESEDGEEPNTRNTEGSRRGEANEKGWDTVNLNSGLKKRTEERTRRTDGDTVRKQRHSGAQ